MDAANQSTATRAAPRAAALPPPSLDLDALWQLLRFALIGFAVLALVLWVLALWNEDNIGDAVDAATGSVTLSLTSEPPQMDSTRGTDTVSFRILGHVMEGLLRYDENNQLVAGVAERWEPGERRWTFHLRPDSVWSNGDPVTAHDFVFAWRKVVDPDNASEYAFILYGIENAEAVNRGELPLEALGVRALDDRTLQVDLARPLPYFGKLTAFATYNPINEAFYNARNGRYGADAQDMLYNGPFVIESWVHGASLRLVKNPDYWDADRIRLNVIDHAYITTDVNATLNLFKDSKVALAALNAESLDDALRHRWRINRFADGSVFYISFNYRPGRLTRSYHLRKALQAVNDPAELVYKIIKLPGNLPGASLFPVWLKGVDGYFQQEYPVQPHVPDHAAARRHLAQALDELGLDALPPLTMLVNDSPESRKMAEYYQNVFNRALGIEIKIDQQIFKQRLAKMTAGEFDLVMAGWGPDYDDPMTFGDLFTSWNENNRGRYSNPALDAAVEVARSTTDPQTRMDAFDTIQNILYDDAAILLQYERGTVYVADPRVKGVVRRAVGTDPDYTNAWIDS